MAAAELSQPASPGGQLLKQDAVFWIQSQKWCTQTQPQQ